MSGDRPRPGQYIFASRAIAAEVVIPGAKGNLVACYAKSNGSVRIIDGSKRCMAREIRISWKRKGRISARGPRAFKGTQGRLERLGQPGRMALMVRLVRGALRGCKAIPEPMGPTA